MSEAATIAGMTVHAVFPRADVGSGMYESFYLRAVAAEEPLGAWIRYTVHKRQGEAPQGSLWFTLFDARVGRPFMRKYTSAELSAPAGDWIAIGADSTFAATRAEGHISSDAEDHRRVESPESSFEEVRWSLRFDGEDPELRHLQPSWLYRAPLPRTKLTSPLPASSFDGSIQLPDRTVEVNGWRGMVGHNWGSEHAERWIWLHGIGFEEDPTVWLDVAIARVLIAGRLTPWLASGAISIGGRRFRLGGLAVRGLRVFESKTRCTLSLPGEQGLTVEAHVETPPDSAAEWCYEDPAGGVRDVVNCSVASLTLNVRRRGEAGQLLHTAHSGVYELGVRGRPS
jgi:hypothetical protein